MPGRHPLRAEDLTPERALHGGRDSMYQPVQAYL